MVSWRAASWLRRGCVVLTLVLKAPAATHRAPVSSKEAGAAPAVLCGVQQGGAGDVAEVPGGAGLRRLQADMQRGRQADIRPLDSEAVSLEVAVAASAISSSSVTASCILTS